MRRRRRAVLLVLLVIAGVLVTIDFFRGPEQAKVAPVVAPVPAAKVEPAPVTPSGAALVRSAQGTFGYAAGPGKVLGVGGVVKRYRVGVENGTGQDVAAFAAEVEQILGDPRSWIAAGNVRLQRVAGTEAAEFTVLLATETTSETLCLEDGLHTEKYTSCRLASGKVVINLTRWLTSIPGYNAPLGAYRAYAVNHEVGHQLGLGHEKCPKDGAAAPVMQQQTLGLHGCVANSWPFVDGKRYTGPPGSYGGES